MNDIIKDTAQICTTVSADLFKEISELAEKENRKLAPMAAILLENAMKERKRKRSGKAKNNT